jgi:hypothetical protein
MNSAKEHSEADSQQSDKSSGALFAFFAPFCGYPAFVIFATLL